MSTSSSSPSEFGIESTNINTATGVELSAQQKILVGSVLDVDHPPLIIHAPTNTQQLFKGLPSLKKLQLWTDDATLDDPLTKAQGRKQYQAQWYGLKAAFSEIHQLEQKVTSAGNPITLDLKTKYKLKGLGTEKIIESVIKIHTDAEGKRIVGVEDRWNGEIPEGAFAKVGVLDLFNPLWWTRSAEMVGFWGWSLVWWSRSWEVREVSCSHLRGLSKGIERWLTIHSFSEVSIV